MEAYCVFHDGNEFIIMNHQTFKENQDTSIVHFIGTYQECQEFVNRSVAEQELVNSANREHEETYTREEVYSITKRVITWTLNRVNENSSIDFCFSDKTLDEIINSEIDTVKLF